jgi:hypothetical protein
MAIDDHPLTVYSRQVENDEIQKPVGVEVIEFAAKAVGAISKIPILRPLGLIAKGLDLTGKCLNLGVPTVEENLKLFGTLTEEAILRHEQELINLKVNALEAEKFQRRVESKEFMQVLASGVLQTQRTTQESRLKRMAWIIANAVKENDLDIESGDDMMRAAVELRDWDIQLLSDIYNARTKTEFELELYNFWKDYWNEFSLRYPNKKSGSILSAFARLESHGLIFRLRREAPSASLTGKIYQITDEGISFYEHLQEIAIQK